MAKNDDKLASPPAPPPLVEPTPAGSFTTSGGVRVHYSDASKPEVRTFPIPAPAPVFGGKGKK